MKDDHHPLKELQNIKSLNKENIKNSKFTGLKKVLKKCQTRECLFTHLLKSALEVRGWLHLMV